MNINAKMFILDTGDFIWTSGTKDNSNMWIWGSGLDIKPYLLGPISDTNPGSMMKLNNMKQLEFRSPTDGNGN